MSSVVSSLPRRHQAPFSSVCPVARLSRLGVAAGSLPLVCRGAGLCAFPVTRGARRGLRPASGDLTNALFDRAASAEPLGARPRLAICLRHALGPVGVEAVSANRAGRCASTPRAAISIRPKPISSAARSRAVRARRPSTTTPRIATCSNSDARLTPTPGRRRAPGEPTSCSMALTSIHWREAWKYGERAFRYCQHDLGHAIAALVVAAAMHGWHARMVPAWSHRAVASLTGLDRDEDFVEAEREEPACLLAIGRRRRPAADLERRRTSRRGRAAGTMVGTREPTERRPRPVDVHRRNRPRDRGSRTIAWTRSAVPILEPRHARVRAVEDACAQVAPSVVASLADAASATDACARVPTRAATSMRGPSCSSAAAPWRSTASRQSIARRSSRMLSRVMPGGAPPWDTLWWTPRVHLAAVRSPCRRSGAGLVPAAAARGRARRRCARCSAGVSLGARSRRAASRLSRDAAIAGVSPRD